MIMQRTTLPKLDRGKAGQWAKRILFYVAGLWILALGVAISVRSNLGVSPVSSVPLVVSNVLHLELGNTTILVFCLYVLAEIAILRKEFRWIQLLQVPCAVLFGKFVTLTSGWLSGWQPKSYAEQLGMILINVVLLAIGIKLYLLADLVPQAADGLMQAISQKGNWKLANVKNIFDLCSISTAAAISLLATGSIIGLREGTVIAALGVGRVLALLNRIDGDRLHHYVFGEEQSCTP